MTLFVGVANFTGKYLVFLETYGHTIMISQMNIIYIFFKLFPLYIRIGKNINVKMFMGINFRRLNINISVRLSVLLGIYADFAFLSCLCLRLQRRKTKL